jgi:hypothetical protein
MNNWTKGKQTRVLILVGLIVALTASFLTFDWAQYAFGIVRIADPELTYSRLTKTLTSFLIFLLALTVGADGIDADDPKRLRRAFVAMFAGDDAVPDAGLLRPRHGPLRPQRLPMGRQADRVIRRM